ncbi:hypothetical protein [Atopobacter phocae]|uniref:hypothetical protein n=1 Tax=Atopobacter phocae TaxID=136492 RepID=UPI00047234F9|nr:hypothetical protein [Atopobacter phocae]
MWHNYIVEINAQLSAAIIGTVVALITGLFKWLGNRSTKALLEQLEEQKAIRNGIRSLLKVHLLKECNRILDQGYMTVPERNEITSVFESYKNLGGNGTGEQIYNECLRLPFKKHKD